MAHQELNADRVKISDLENEIGQIRDKFSNKKIHIKMLQSDVELSLEALQEALLTGKVIKALLKDRETNRSHLRESILQMALAFDPVCKEEDSLKRKFKENSRQAGNS